MRKATLELLRCPKCRGALALTTTETGDEIESGTLGCAPCVADYPIKGGIPRFVPAENYAHNFGIQWNMFRKTQLDSHSGQPISRDRFLKYTGWTEADLKGALVLDAGCGAGRFAEVALSLGARLIAIDFSTAIEAARENLKDKGDVDFIQADITALPFSPETFDYVYCLGVIQHTPSPERTFEKLVEAVRPGGKLALDSYPRSWKKLFMAYYWIRPLTRRMKTERSLRLVRRLFPAMYGVSRVVCRIPLIGYHARYLIPVSNYTNVLPLNKEQLREWALLDTFDQWAPAYDQPQTLSTIRSWFQKAGFKAVEVFHSGIFVGRGTKPERAE
jgi:SAM-dependent methyltransferase